MCVLQVQTRSADEPMTTFVLCNECGNRWKVTSVLGLGLYNSDAFDFLQKVLKTLSERFLFLLEILVLLTAAFQVDPSSY